MAQRLTKSGGDRAPAIVTFVVIIPSFTLAYRSYVQVYPSAWNTDGPLFTQLGPSQTQVSAPMILPRRDRRVPHFISVPQLLHL